MKTVYIETTIISYLTARSSSSLIAAARQKETVDWWELRRESFKLRISDIVMEEIGKGDQTAALKRIKAIEGIEVLPVNLEIVDLSNALIKEGGVPKKAQEDSLHIAIAAVHNIDFLLTWNYKHIDNAQQKPRIRDICKNLGVNCPEIATPSELMEP